MKQIPILMTLALAASLGACSRSDSSSSGDRRRADAVPPDIRQKPDWQLREASTVRATIEPWPPQEGAATLRAEVTIGANGKFAGTVQYRLAAAPENSEAWKPVPKLSEDQDGTVHFEGPVTLSKGTVYPQFRVSDRGAKDGFSVLTDWKVTVK